MGFRCRARVVVIVAAGCKFDYRGVASVEAVDDPACVKFRDTGGEIGVGEIIPSQKQVIRVLTQIYQDWSVRAVFVDKFQDWTESTETSRAVGS